MVPAQVRRINYYQVSMTVDRSLGSHAVPPYVVGCVHADARLMAEGHLHVTAVETIDPDGGTTRWSLVQVIEAVRAGERFTLREGAGEPAEITPTVCPRCSVATVGVEGAWQRLPICQDARGSPLTETP